MNGMRDVTRATHLAERSHKTFPTGLNIMFTWSARRRCATSTDNVPDYLLFKLDTRPEHARTSTDFIALIHARGTLTAA